MGLTQLNIPRDYFYGKVKVEIPQPRRLDRGAGGEQSLDDAAALIAQAKFPVIISGGGVVMADAIEECKALAERLGAPVVNSYLHNDSFPANHPLWCGPLGYQLEGGDEAAVARGRRDRARLAPRAVRHAAAARDGLLAEGREDHPDRRRSQDARPREEDLGRHLRRREGRGGRARATPRRPHARVRRSRGERADQIATEKAAWRRNSTTGRTSATPTAST